jgi:hypothetical protein
VKKRVGGHKGCKHLTELLMVMVAATFNGVWFHQRRNAEGRKVPRAIAEKLFADNCRVLRREGPVAKKIFGINREY